MPEALLEELKVGREGVHQKPADFARQAIVPERISARTTSPEKNEPMSERPHTLNIQIPQALRRRIADTVATTGEPVSSFIRAAIVDRLLRLDSLRTSTERTDR